MKREYEDLKKKVEEAKSKTEPKIELGTKPKYKKS